MFVLVKKLQHEFVWEKKGEDDAFKKIVCVKQLLDLQVLLWPYHNVGWLDTIHIYLFSATYR